MYEVDSAKFTSKPDPKKEFINYFKESGAAAALQRAMVLLYRMPVKPTNLAEYFSQYFENGAQGLMRISLLKAELCYKQTEFQNRIQKIQDSENRIKHICDILKISNDEFINRFVPSRVKENKGNSLAEQYSKYGDFEAEARDSINKGYSHYEKRLESMNEYDHETECLKDIPTEQAIRQDVKELDPWSIIYKYSKESKKRSSVRKSTDKNGYGSKLVGSKTDFHAKEHAENQDDDNDDEDDVTLAELFNQYSRDWSDIGNDLESQQLHHRLLLVKRADQIKMADFMGWSPLGSKEDFTSDWQSSSIPNDYKRMTPRKLKKLAAYDALESPAEDAELDNQKQSPCSRKMMEMIKERQEQASAKLDNHPTNMEQETDAFLFDDDDDLEQVYKMLETTHHSFDYEITRHVRTNVAEPHEDVCEPVCSVSEVALVCPTDLKLIDQCPCGEDQCQCTPPVSKSGSMGFIPGKMINWTHQYEEYPCSSMAEYEGAPDIEGMLLNQPQCGVRQKSIKKLSIPVVRIDSSCRCLLAASYSPTELLGEREVLGINKKKNSFENPSNSSITVTTKKRVSGVSGSSSNKIDEGTNTDPLLEVELDEVFKPKRTSVGGNSEKERIGKNKLQIDPIAVDDDEEFSMLNAADIYGIDLAKEVKRDILGFSLSELNPKPPPPPPNPKNKIKTQASTSTFKKQKENI